MILACRLVSTIARCIARSGATAPVCHKNVLGLHWKGGNLTSTMTNNQVNIMIFFSVTAKRTHALHLTIWKVHCDVQVCEVGALVGIFCIFIRRHSCNHSGERARRHWMQKGGKVWIRKFVSFSNVRRDPGNQNKCDCNLDAWFTGNRCGEWMTDVLTVGLPSNHRQMISQSCCKHCSMGSLRHHNNLYYLQKVLGHCWNWPPHWQR